MSGCAKPEAMAIGSALAVTAPCEAKSKADGQAEEKVAEAKPNWLERQFEWNKKKMAMR